MGLRALFVLWDGGGNVNPVIALAHRLAARGHGVTCLGPATLAARMEDERIGFVARDPTGEWDPARTAEDVLAAADAHQPDLVIVDYMLPGALCGAERSGRPFAALVHTLFTALRAPDGDVPTMAMAAQLPVVGELRAALGLPPVGRMAELLDRAAAVLVTCPRELDAPGDVPANVRYVGPVLEGAGPDAAWRPPDDGATTPLVAVSLGTTAMDEGPLLQRALDALAALPVRVVATVGAHLDPAAFAPGERGRVERYVRHAAVLPHASLLVTHAGLGSVLAALAHGVPLVCAPLGREQPANAAAVERVGAGRVLASDADVEELRAAVGAVLDGDAYRGAAARMAATIAGYGDAAVVEVERAAATA